jgi:Kef-type K+ transport system membrane component KefB
MVVDLALALLLFELGSRVRLGWLRANPALMLTSAAEAVLSFAAIYALLRWLQQPVGVALVCATLGTCASGAVIARVAGELKAAGQVTERMIVLTALNTLVAVLAHKLVLGWLHIEVAGDWVRAVSQPLWAFGGSVLVAAALAFVVAWVARRLDLSDENAALLLLGLVVLALTTAQFLNLSTLLVPLLAGVLLRNRTERPWVWPRHFGTSGGALVLMLFVIVGSAWSPKVLVAGGFAALALMAARFLAKAVSIVALAPAAKSSWRQGLALAITMTPLSGTALVMLSELMRAEPELAAGAVPIIRASIAVLELIGPIAVQFALRLAGELPPSPRRARKNKEASE